MSEKGCMSEIGSMLFNYLSDVNKAQAIIDKEDESTDFLFNGEPVPEPDSFICSACNGSGEGMYDGSRCPVCKGHGEVPNENIRREIYEVCDDFDY